MISINYSRRFFIVLNYSRRLFSNKPHTEVTRQHRGLSMKDIVKVDTTKKLYEALADLTEQTVLGFDTESQPNFVRGGGGHRSGPHLIQLSTIRTAYLFPIPNHVSQNTSIDHNIQQGLTPILQSYDIRKVGFGTKEDCVEIKRKLGIEVKNLLDLGKTLWDWEDPNRNQRTVSTKAGVLQFLNTIFNKNRWVSTSNWGMPLHKYTSQMILYAGNDAHAALLVYNAWFDSVQRGKYESRWVDNYCNETWHHSKNENVPDELKRMYAPPDDCNCQYQ